LTSSANQAPAISADTQTTIPEAARVLADVTVPHLSQRGHIHLHLLLGSRRTFPTMRGVRRRRLAVILDFMHAHGRRPTLSEYITEHERRTAAGDDVPSVKQLYAWFGSWPFAVSVAARYFYDGTGARAPSRKPRARPRGSVTERRLLDSVEAVYEELDHWPSDIEYFALHNAERLLRLKLGVGHIDLFSIKAFKDTFGSYGEGRAAAQRRLAERARVHADRLEKASTQPPTPSRKGRSQSRRTRSSHLRPPS